jgi:hypothetical protein
MECTKEVIKKIPFLVLFVDAITKIDIESWISIYGYVFENWWWIFVLLNLEKVIDNVTIENIYNMMLWTLVIQGGLTKVEIGKKLVSIGTNGGSMFTRCKTGVLVQMKEKVTLYLVAMRCCARCTNLAIQTLSSLSIVQWSHYSSSLLGLDSWSCFIYEPYLVF